MPFNAVTAKLNYTVPPPDGGKVAYETYNLGKLKEKNTVTMPHDEVIEDIRGKEHLYNLDNAGFQYLYRPTKHTNFDDTRELEEYYRESAEILREVTGAKYVIFTSSVQRSSLENEKSKTKQWLPASSVHVDVTEAAALERLRQRNPLIGRDPRRWQIVNLWRPIEHGAYDLPLAFCTWSSVDPKSDAFTYERRSESDNGETRINESMGVRYNPNHKWKYVPGMSPSDLVLLKNFDSDENVAGFTPHTAFEDPTTPKDAPPRRSIELRFLVIYE